MLNEKYDSVHTFKWSSLVIEDRKIPKSFSIASNAGEHLIYSIAES